MDPVRIFYCGVPLGAEVLRRAGFSPVALAYGPLDLPGRRRLRRLLPEALHMDLPDLGDPQTQTDIAHRGPSVLLSFFWPKRIPEALLALPNGAFGTHPSLLPKLRGPDPYFWALRRGAAVTGVTLHGLEANYDTGPILRQIEMAIPEASTAWSLAKSLDRPATELLVWAARQLSEGVKLQGRAQDDEGATFAPTPSHDDLRVNWRDSAESLLRLVRAASPEPGAHVLLGDVPAELTAASIENAPPPMGLRIGEAWKTESKWAVRCGEGSLGLDGVRDLEGQPLNLDRVFGK